MANKSDINAERTDAEWYAMGLENRINDLKNKVEKSDLTQAHNNEMSLKNQENLEKDLSGIKELIKEVKAMMRDGETKDGAALFALKEAHELRFSLIEKGVALHNRVLYMAIGFITCLGVVFGFVLDAAAKLLEVKGHL